MTQTMTRRWAPVSHPATAPLTAANTVRQTPLDAEPDELRETTVRAKAPDVPAPAAPRQRRQS